MLTPLSTVPAAQLLLMNQDMSAPLALLKAIAEFPFDEFLDACRDDASSTTAATVPLARVWIAPELWRNLASDTDAKRVFVASPTTENDGNPTIRCVHAHLPHRSNGSLRPMGENIVVPSDIH